MLSTSIALHRSARRLSSLALIGAAALTACDNDQPLAPTAKPVPTEASAAVGVQSAQLSITIKDEFGAAPTTVGASFTVHETSNPYLSTKTYILPDNGPGDTNPTANKLTMKLIVGTYEVCQTAAPTGYGLPATPCQTVMVGGIVAASLTFINAAGHFSWNVFDWGLNVVGGATFTFDDGSGPVAIVDDSALDLDKTPGKFEIVALKSGNVCPVAPPSGWSFGSFCDYGNAVAGQTKPIADSWVNADYSIYWQANNYSGLAGGSSYTVTGLGGRFNVTITDDDKQDRWHEPGMMWILLPAPGDYQICQITPPPKTMLANPACVTVTVGYAQAEYGGMFMNYPL